MQSGEAACGAEAGAAGLIDPEDCPSELESRAGKIHHEAYLQMHRDETQQAAIWLRSDLFPPLPECETGAAQSDGGEASCTTRDEALRERQRLNVQQVHCVVDALDGPGEIIPLWYELPFHLTSGQPLPIGLAFGTTLSVPQIERAARHPYVARIEPPPRGEAARLGVPPPAPPCGCPEETDPVGSKLDELEVMGNRRQPVIVELKADLLPEPPTPREVPSLDDEHVFAERTLLNRRHNTCVGRALDAVLTAPPLAVSYVAGHVGDLRAAIPPFDQPAATHEGFGTGLTWEEAEALAAHPYVDRIRAFPGGTDPGQAGCPANYAAPIPERECPGDREPGASKLDPSLERLRQDPGPHEAAITVSGGGTVCPAPNCPEPPNPCPERDRMFERRAAENLASQRCVRDLVAALAGTVTEDFELINGFVARLTWPQIEALAEHPHVTWIQPNEGDPNIPPP